MTVLSTTNRKSYAGDGVTTSFSTSPVVFFDTTDLTVYAVVTATGAATTLTENTHYTVTGGNGAAGTVNLAGGATPYGAPAAGYTLRIVRSLPVTQEVDLQNNDSSDAAVQEEAFDRGIMIDQQLDAKIDRSIHLADSDVSGLVLELPVVTADGFLKANAAGTAFEYAAVTDISTTALTLPVPIAQGGTAAITAVAALTALGAMPAAGGTMTGALTVQGNVTLDTAGALVFEGATANAFETTLSAVDPTADNAIVLPDASGTVALTSALVTVATQADQETATSTTTYVSPGRQQYHPGMAKAWVVFNGTGTPAILASYNVASITDHGSGDYTITFTTAFSSANYAVIGSASNIVQGVSVATDEANPPTASACRIKTQSSGSTGDPARVSVVFFGDQA